MTTPLDEYRTRLDARRASHARLLVSDERLSYTRLAVFGLAVLVAWLAVFRGAVSPAWLIPLAAAFGWLVTRHDRVIRRRDAAARAIVFYERGLARIEDRWIGTGEPGDRFQDDEHLYANDLDLFGRGSLFELLSMARTRAGEETLAGWLKAPAAPDVVRTRQQAVEEMAPLVDLREELALAGSDVRAGVDTDRLVAWAAAPPVLESRWPWVVTTALTAAGIAAAYWSYAIGALYPLMGVGVVDGLFWAALKGRLDLVLHTADQAARDLDVLAHVLERLERERFASARLAALRTSLDATGMAPSAAIRRLHRLSEMHDWAHNQFFGLFAGLLLWSTHLAFAIELWRKRHGSQVAGWLATVGEFEAFSSLSAYRYEHPEDPFPDIVESGLDTSRGRPSPLDQSSGCPEQRRRAGRTGTFDAEALGHPLLPAAKLVRNDVHLADDVQLLVVSGSNMSGKSTLLRTVGINAVLALMGAPVRASRLRLTPLCAGATLRIQDSLQEGRSRFYAEITRLRRLADVAASAAPRRGEGATPLLFLLDELFHGTNSHDRLVGATGVLRSLLDRGAIGLITTHDLALTQIATDLAPRAANVHFEDTFDGGEITFDYRMKPGPVTRSNALALMRAVGLDVGSSG